VNLINKGLEELLVFFLLENKDPIFLSFIASYILQNCAAPLAN
jgi:hypothetical protein